METPVQFTTRPKRGGRIAAWDTLPDASLGGEISQSARHFFVARVGIHGRRQRRHVAGKPLRQEQVPRRPVDVGDRRMPQTVEGVEPIEPGPLLPVPPRELHPPLRHAPVVVRRDRDQPLLIRIHLRLHRVVEGSRPAVRDRRQHAGRHLLLPDPARPFLTPSEGAKSFPGGGPREQIRSLEAESGPNSFPQAAFGNEFGP